MEPQVQENKSGIGSIIGTIIIIAIIILGGLYFWGKRVEEARIKQELVGETMMQETEDANNGVEQTSSSDDIDSIGADLNATNIDDLDAEVNAQLE